mmetsp:Transcript_9208/g.18364  ORF Transcript_9208/g.18364 Transcript_9208/m.18364 type:complete len:337 (-) Transcript_9208:322-1332(-)|eukprot:CAMPEP_0181295008 /NCGR_PEP_ID=MMETSP1101-20121128/3910_1 /TAXON_ID=46948 /ORGANISM="Rhodomonas abbreviata, Strain Caron Lab Isolate" /LENGTH=336 /DNA_ID=CAMNT_0023399715 /DNA_START=123 /DNA_END=1133 /DNA_ORIENTATION=+
MLSILPLQNAEVAEHLLRTKSKMKPGGTGKVGKVKKPPSLKYLGNGRTFGLKRWLLKKGTHVRNLESSRHKNRRNKITHDIIERNLRPAIASDLEWQQDEVSYAASVLSDASTVPEDTSVSESAWHAVASKAQCCSAEADEVADHGVASSKHVQNAKRRPGSCLAIDCEMVGVGKYKNRSILARVAIVDDEGNVILDEFVRPTERITDFRTKYSGIRPRSLVGAPPFDEVRDRVASIVRGRILIGHAIINDLKVLNLPHPSTLLRDTSLYKPLRKELEAVCPKYNASQPPSLKNLSLNLLGKKIQEGEHCPVQDALHTMQLYVRHRAEWESALLLA